MDKTLSPAASETLYFASSEFGAQHDERAFHGFFGRGGGVSRDVYASLNCGAGSDDEAEHVAANRAIVAREAGVDVAMLLNVHQVHGDVCVHVDGPWVGGVRPQADAMVTDRAGLALGVLTADCGPVLFYGEKDNGAPVIGAAHAGWGGALKGVLASTVEQMKGIGATAGSISACVGPCIGQNSYEVQEIFAQAFLEEDDENERFFMAGARKGHLMFDLSGYCAFKLFKAGVKNVFIKDLDTYFNEADFYSYRRATHRGDKDYGRQISVICINEG